MQENIFRSAMKSGLILGALFTLNFILSMPDSVAANLLSYVVTAVIIVAMWRLSCQFRDNDCEGVINYGKSLGFILLSFFYASLISAVVKIIYFQFINPDFLSEIYNQAMLAMEQMGFPITNETEAALRSILKPVPYSFLSIFGNMIYGLILGLIMSAFVKKEKSIFEQ